MEKTNQSLQEHFVHIGERDGWGGTRPFGLGLADRRQHAYIIGQTGSGKTTLLKSLIAQDIEAGFGVAVLDPHGDLADELLDLIPPWRTDDLIYFDPADLEYPVGLNLLANVEADQRHLVTSGVVGALKSIWGDTSWGPRMEYILANAVAALMECQNVSLLGIQRLLVDERYLGWVIRQVRDPAVRQFWNGEFASWDRRFRVEAVAPIQNKVGQLLLSPPVRNVLGQIRSAFNARYIMDHRRIFIANLSKGRLGADKSDLLGAILVTQFQLAAMSRADVPEHQRPDFLLYVDEFQNFGTESFISILSEARKYHLCLTLCHQHLEQIPDPLRDSIFGNAGSFVSFRVSESNGSVMSRAYGHIYPPETFTGLQNFQICCRLLERGRRGEPFLGTTLAPDRTYYNSRAKLLRRSRDRYATPRHVVENRIRRWLTA
jgi:GTPase SAR1 family protein